LEGFLSAVSVSPVARMREARRIIDSQTAINRKEREQIGSTRPSVIYHHFNNLAAKISI